MKPELQSLKDKAREWIDFLRANAPLSGAQALTFLLRAQSEIQIKELRIKAKMRNQLQGVDSAEVEWVEVKWYAARLIVAIWKVGVESMNPADRVERREVASLIYPRQLKAEIAALEMLRNRVSESISV